VSFGWPQGTAPFASFVAGALSALTVISAIFARPQHGASHRDADPSKREFGTVSVDDSLCTSSDGEPDFQRDMRSGMARMMIKMHEPGYSGNVDIDFLAMMIPHHQGAVDMARLELLHGRDPSARQLAEEIIATQTIEVEGMTRRLAAVRRQRTGDHVIEFPSLGGLRGPGP